MSRARTAIRGRLGRAVVATLATLVLQVLPASCPCAGATMASVAPPASAGCHGHSQAPRPFQPERGGDCAHCQVAVASSPGQQTLSPPPPASRPIAAGQVSMSSGAQPVRGTPMAPRASRPPARAILLAKRVLLL